MLALTLSIPEAFQGLPEVREHLPDSVYVSPGPVPYRSRRHALPERSAIGHAKIPMRCDALRVTATFVNACDGGIDRREIAHRDSKVRRPMWPTVRVVSTHMSFPSALSRSAKAAYSLVATCGHRPPSSPTSPSKSSSRGGRTPVRGRTASTHMWFVRHLVPEHAEDARHRPLHGVRDPRVREGSHELLQHLPLDHQEPCGRTAKSRAGQLSALMPYWWALVPPGGQQPPVEGACGSRSASPRPTERTGRNPNSSASVMA